MFTALMGLAKVAPLVIKVDAKDDKLVVIVVPTPKAGQEPTPAALSQPVRFEGTPEELDREFPSLMERYTGAYAGMKEAVDAAISVANAAAEDARKRAAEAVKQKGKATVKAGNTAKAGAKDASQDNASDSDDTDPADAGAGTEPAPKAEAPKAPSLF